ncbi:MAG: ATP-grasp domain-containing protein [Eubacteriales bacterium]|nr:ATP-grasp domain-containing protein [Eubacteriales bacterium]
MKKYENKRLLIIGATSYFIDVIQEAKKMGIYTICTDYNPNAIAKKYADKSYDVNTVDHEAILQLAKDEKVDGVFVAWSDANLYTAQYVCEKLGMPFYATKDQLDCAVNKDYFKQMCRNYNVPCTKQYQLDESFKREDLDQIEYPVIVKPVDNGGSRGITVCNCEEELKEAFTKALSYSKRKNVIVEQFMENQGKTISVKYLIRDGVPYLLSVGDRRVLDAHDGKALITSAAIYPASITQRYKDTLDEKVRKMLIEMGFRNGQLFMEAIPAEDEIYFYEMGYRLSGGITYHITDSLTGINGMRMLINFALSGEMCDQETAERIDPFMQGKAACSFAILMKQGTVTKINGLEEVRQSPNVLDITQYYKEGMTVEPRDVGNVGQMFARITTIGKNREDLVQVIHQIEERICILDENGEDMFLRAFDPNTVLE